MKTVSPLWFIIGFPIYFATLWCSIIWFLARVGGWARLAKHYPATTVPQGYRFGGVSASLGWTNYNGCLTAIVAEQGLYLKPWAMFSISHSPLLIPWSALSPITERKFMWAKSGSTQISLPDGSSIKLTLNTTTLVEAMQAKMGSNAVERSDSAWSN
ncbi:hypothetical protein EON80_08930 [bacterium]|nr:MAG: hypothetical protein EON80_08930 [bacterium]